MTKLLLSAMATAALALLPASLSAADFATQQRLRDYPSLSTRHDATGRVELMATTATEIRQMGYTDRAVTADVEIPDNMKAWLRDVEEATAWVNEHPEYTLGTATHSSTVIQPLLRNIMWDQSQPYNMYCPTGCPTGCVATAMAQVLYHYRYPEHGYLSKTYTQGGNTISADFEHTYYQWNLMYDYYNGRSTREQDQAVAELSYHCGVAALMSYAPEGSGAYLERVPYALHKYFGYNSKAMVRKRIDFTYEDWSALLVEELKAGRPIIFAANSDDVGHCFVIDGINSEGLFHVNWGWGGHYNGYFDIGILNPNGTGTGGSQSFEFGYCFGQGAIFQLCPEEGTGIDLCPISCERYGFWDMMRSGFTVGYTFQNNYGGSVQATVGVEIIDEQGETVLRLPGKQFDFSAYPSRGCWQWEAFQVPINGSLPDGTYTFGAYCLIPSHDSTYYHMDAVPDFTHLSFTVTSGKATAYNETEEFFDITVSNINFSSDQILAVGTIYDCTFEVTNLNQSTFVGMVSPTFMTFNSDGRFETNYKFGSPDLKILPGETVNVSVPVWVNESGTWDFYIEILDYGLELTNYVSIDDAETISAEFTADSPASLSLTETPRLLTERCEVDGDIAFEMTVDNQGGNFSDRIAMMLFANKTATENPSLIIESAQELAMTSTDNAVSVTGKLTGLKGMTKYYARPYYEDQRHNYKQLNLATGKVNPIEVKVYNATGIEHIHADQTAEAPAFDLMGRRIEGEPRSLYIQHNATSLR